jgi:hypothetical protein
MKPEKFSLETKKSFGLAILLFTVAGSRLTELFETPFFSDFLLMRTQKSLTLNKTM